MMDVPLTYDELDELFRGDGQNDFIGLSAIDGMIAALIAGPAVVPRERWLPEIFAGHMPSATAGSPESRSAATIMARYAEVEQSLARRPPTYQPILMHHLGRFIVRPWAIGFMMGVGLSPNAWASILISSKRQEMRPILAGSELGRPMLPEMSNLDVERVAASTDALQISHAVVAVHRFHAARRNRTASNPSQRSRRSAHSR